MSDATEQPVTLGQKSEGATSDPSTILYSDNHSSEDGGQYFHCYLDKCLSGL